MQTADVTVAVRDGGRLTPATTLAVCLPGAIPVDAGTISAALRLRDAGAYGWTATSARTAGAGVTDLVRLRDYVVDFDPACRDTLLPAIAEFLGDCTAPASTLIGVPRCICPAS